MTVAIYARVSTADQNANLQLEQLRDYAAKRNFTVYREYVDQITGLVESRKKHTAYDELLKDAQMLRFQVVICWKFDRFARSLVALLQALKTFEALHIDFISVTQAIDTTTPWGDSSFRLSAPSPSLTGFDFGAIQDWNQSARSRGVVFGRPRVAEVDARIQQLREEGLGINAIARKVKRSPAGVLRILRRFGLAGCCWSRGRQAVELCQWSQSSSIRAACCTAAMR